MEQAKMASSEGAFNSNGGYPFLSSLGGTTATQVTHYAINEQDVSSLGDRFKGSVNSNHPVSAYAGPGINTSRRMPPPPDRDPLRSASEYVYKAQYASTQ